MINKAASNTFARHVGNKPNTQAAADNIKEKATDKNPSDALYILDLSGMSTQNGQNAFQSDETAALLDWTDETREKLGNMALRGNERTEETNEGEPPRPNDDTRKLTRMLVAAKSPDEVQFVLVDVYNHMREWQELAANGDKKAMAVVRKLNRLISRGNRKISDLNKEIIMHQRQQAAEQSEKNQLAKRLEIELKEAQRERKARERRYLQEQDDDDDEESAESGPTVAETEAKIRQLAAAMAALKTNAVDVSNVGVAEGVTDAGSVGGTESAEMSGEESADE